MYMAPRMLPGMPPPSMPHRQFAPLPPPPGRYFGPPPPRGSMGPYPPPMYGPPRYHLFPSSLSPSLTPSLPHSILSSLPLRPPVPFGPPPQWLPPMTAEQLHLHPEGEKGPLPAALERAEPVIVKYASSKSGKRGAGSAGGRKPTQEGSEKLMVCLTSKLMDSSYLSFPFLPLLMMFLAKTNKHTPLLSVFLPLPSCSSSLSPSFFSPCLSISSLFSPYFLPL